MIQLQCYQCRTPIMPGARICHVCGYPLVANAYKFYGAPDVPESEPEPDISDVPDLPDEPAAMICSRCYAKNHHLHSYCTNCGERLVSADARFISKSAEWAALAMDRPGTAWMIGFWRNPQETVIGTMVAIGVFLLLAFLVAMIPPH